MSKEYGQVIKLETKVWEALRTGNAEQDAQLLSDDFLGVYPTGFSSKSEHCGQLSNGPTVRSYKITDTKVIALTEDLVLLSYLAIWQRVDAVSTNDERMYISSIWRRTDGRWLNVFSQDTPAP